MAPVFDTNLVPEPFEVFEVVQITRGTPLESVVAADLVTVGPGRTSEVHRHNHAETVILIMGGSGRFLVGDEWFDVREGTRLRVGKGVYHGVRTAEDSLTFLSVQAPPILDKTHGTLDLEPLSAPAHRGVSDPG